MLGQFWRQKMAIFYLFLTNQNHPEKLNEYCF